MAETRLSKVNDCDDYFIAEKPDVECSHQSDAQPKDRFRIIFVLFFLLGIVQVLPFSFFLMASDYWMYKFRNVSISDSEQTAETRTNLQRNFYAVLDITLQVSNVVFLILGLLFAYKIKIRVRLIGTLSVILSLYVACAAFIYIDTDSWQEEFFILTMTIVALINALNAIFALTLYTTFSNFAEHMKSFVAGQGLASVCTSTLQVISLAIGASTKSSAMIYFSLGIMVIAVTLLMLIASKANAFYNYHMERFRESSSHEDKALKLQEVKEIFPKIWTSVAIMALWVFTANPVQSSVIPLVVSQGEGQGPWNDKYFVPVATFFTLSVAHLLGTLAATLLKYQVKPVLLTIFSVVKFFVLVPLLMLCNAQPRQNLPVVFDQDYQYIIILIVFGFTNGYLISIAGLNISKLVPERQSKTAYKVFYSCYGFIVALLSPLNLAYVEIL